LAIPAQTNEMPPILREFILVLPLYRTFLPAIFRAAQRPCSTAWGHSGFHTGAFLTTSYAWATSPAAYIPGTLVSINSSTRSPFSTATAVSPKTFSSGFTPAAITAISASRLVPSDRVTLLSLYPRHHDSPR